MEIVGNPHPTATPKAALFDFDGTVSYIVAGWRELMIEQFVTELRATPHGADEPDLEEFVADFVDRNTGKPTISQGLRIAEEITRRGGTPREPFEYLKDHSRRMLPRITERVEGLQNGTVSPDSLMVPGVRSLLEALRRRGLVLYLASGSKVDFVKDECEWLGITEFFDGGIFGSLPDPDTFSKAAVIADILKTRDIKPAELIGFGDGHTETANLRQVGGFVIGVASVEHGVGNVNSGNGNGTVDPVKRRLLIDAGADVVIPDYSRLDALLARLFPDA